MIEPLVTNTGDPAVGLTTIVNVDDAVYAFRTATGEAVTLKLSNGKIKSLSNLDLPSGVPVGGATPVIPAPVQ